MEGIERIPEKPRPTAPTPNSEGRDSGALHAHLVHRGLDHSRLTDPEIPPGSKAAESPRTPPRLPASFLVVDRTPPGGFASPFRVSPEVEDRWFRPPPSRSSSDAFRT
jgi:hypothetical protein